MSVRNTPKPLVGLLLRLAAQHWGIDMDAALRAHGIEGITPAHANVIPFVPPEGIQIGALARAAKVRKQSMAQSVDLLIDSGYAMRRPDPTDARASLIFLTDKGRALGPASLSAGQRVEEDWSAIVGRDALEHLRETLIQLLQLEPPDPRPQGNHRPKSS